MTYQALSTKLYIPPVQPNLVRRPRLIQHLEDGYRSGKRVTLVSAPAGFGKTTLIREWIGRQDAGVPFGWLSLDDGDNDPVRFLIYLVAAVRKADPGVGQSIQSSLQAVQVPPLAGLMEMLINEISSRPRPFLVVLDDYHLIKKAEVHALMQLFLKLQPEPAHLVIITREDPPFPLPRMRVQGHITEVRERDLRFSLPEAQAFLVNTMKLQLSTQEVGKLEERTEGWAAGMQLAALALEDLHEQSERHAFIEAFTGNDRLIFDYLISEVLQRQNETTRKFLIRTSILERFCADLCDQVVFDQNNTGQSQLILDALEQANMFLIPLDNQRHWYRYHHLFSEMLYHSLKRTSSDLIPVLHHKAGQWFEMNALIPEAFKHALASQDWKYVNGLLDRYALPIIFPGYGRLVIDWCSQIPREYLEKAPDICIYYAWALVLTFREDYMGMVKDYLQMAERAIQRTDLPEFAPVGECQTSVPFKDWVRGHVYAIRSQILLGHFFKKIDPQEEIDLSLKGLELLPECELISRSICRINLAHAQTMQNNPVEGLKAFEEALPYMLASRNFLGAVAATFYMSRLALYMEHIDRGEAVCQHWKKVFDEMASPAGNESQPVAEVPASRGLDIVQGIILLERGQLDEAEDLFVQALDMLGWGSWMELHGFYELAKLQFSRRDYVGAEATLQRMLQLGPQHAACAEALQNWFDITRSPDDPQVRTRVSSWASQHAPDPEISLALGIGPYHRDTEYICNLVWAHVQISLGHIDAAYAFIEPALEIARERGLLFRTAELSIAKALSAEGLGDHPAALEALEKALGISEQCGYTRFFNDGLELDRLLKQAVEMKIHAQYARQLLASFDRQRSAGRPAAAALQAKREQPGLVEPLSERELEVLRFLADGLAPVEVARKLFLSPFTLKAHTQNIYAKLNVHSRIEAINKARALGLIE
jgi:LuxR family maltose regulon positive regulatory protein